MEMTEKTREEIKALICQALNEREKQTTANKSVYRRICGDFEPFLNQFDYVEPNAYTDMQGVKHDTTVSCNYKIREAVGALLRIVYKVKVIPSLPAEHESHMRYFMRSILELMDALRNEN